MQFKEQALRFAAKARNATRRYFATFWYVLKPYNSDIREAVLTRKFAGATGPLIFFGVTTAISAFAIDKLARYQVKAIDLQPKWWLSPFDLEIFNVNLKNTCVDFINALALALIAYTIAKLFRQAVTLRRCLSAFLYAYAIFILFSAIKTLIELSFFTTPEQVGINNSTHTFPNGSSAWLNIGVERFAFIGDQLKLPRPSFLSGSDLSQYSYMPAIFPLFHTSGISTNYVNGWYELSVVLILLDFKVALAAYILRLRFLVSATIIIVASVLGFYLDAVISRTTGKHGMLLYASGRMVPSVIPQQAIKYGPTYFDNFPLKTADLALIDFKACKEARLDSNHNFSDGTPYLSGGAHSFEMTYTDCTGRGWSVRDFLLPDYEIVRVVATAGQTVEINAQGEIKVDGALIAEAISKTEETFQYSTLKGLFDGSYKPGATPTPEQLKWVYQPKQGHRYEYEYYRTRLPHEPNIAAYVWECLKCSSEIVGGPVEIPQGAVFGMFDNQARPRFVLFNQERVLGYPFVKSEKRW